MPMIDTSFDYRTDSSGKDPDSHSKRLFADHRRLYSKTLPNGKELILDADLRNCSDAGDFVFGNDCIIHSFSGWKRYHGVIGQVPKEVWQGIKDIGYTIGGEIIFPVGKDKSIQSINQKRGTLRAIDDRFDITLECIRRYYKGEWSPLSDTFNNFKDFFSLFVDFRGYVDFFYLKDLVTDSYDAVRFWFPFDGRFEGEPLPPTPEDYKKYAENVIRFVKCRNERIATITEL